MNKLDDFLKVNPSIDESQLLSEDELKQLYGGGEGGCVSCSSRCSQSCANGGSGVIGPPGN